MTKKYDRRSAAPVHLRSQCTSSPQSSPLSLVLGKDLALGVVADGLDVDKAPDIELLGPEHGHCGCLYTQTMRAGVPDGDVGDYRTVARNAGRQLSSSLSRCLHGNLGVLDRLP